MSLMPEVERELLRAARRAPLDEDEIGQTGRAAGRPRRWGRTTSALLTSALAFVALAFAGLLLVLLDHHRPATQGAAAHHARTYRNQAGWSIVVPPGWHVISFRESWPGVTSAGAQISNVRLPAPKLVHGYVVQVDGRALPARGIALIISASPAPRGGPGISVVKPPLPSPYPAGGKGWDLGSAPPGSPYTESLWFHDAGRFFLANASVGAKAPRVDLKAFAAIIRSLRMQPAARAAARSHACTAAQLRLDLGPTVSPQTGENPHLFTLVNHSRHDCTVEGYPQITLGHKGTKLPFVYLLGGAYVTKERPRPVALAPSARAYFLIAKYRCDGGVAAHATVMGARLPGTSHAITIGLDNLADPFDYCRRYPGDHKIDPGNYVDVSPIEPTRASALAAPRR